MAFEEPDDLTISQENEFTLERRSWWLGSFVRFTIKGHSRYLKDILALCSAQIKGIKEE